jgi:hypothetical protein
MLLIQDGYCVEAGQDGWSRPIEQEVGHMKALDPRNLAEVENHSAQREVIFAGLGDTAAQSTVISV